MSFTSATDVHDSMLVSLQCEAALIMTLLVATLLKAYGVLDDRGVYCEPNAGYCWETFGQDFRCLLSFFLGALACHLLDAPPSAQHSWAEAALSSSSSLVLPPPLSPRPRACPRLLLLIITAPAAP